MRHDLNRRSFLQKFKIDWKKSPQGICPEYKNQTFFHRCDTFLPSNGRNHIRELNFVMGFFKSEVIMICWYNPIVTWDG